MTEPLDIETSARLAGAHRWVERRLFEILGRWSAAVPEPAVKALVGAQSFHHAWRAEMWEACLPSLPHVNPELLAGPPSAGLAAFFDDVADVSGEHDAAGKLVGVFRVAVPRLRVAYATRRARSAGVTDAPVIRALDLVEPDLVRDGEAGERQLQALLRTGDDARRAGERQGRLEALLIEAGGIP